MSNGIRLAPEEKCTGCMACRNVCPNDAILSVQNGRGFFRPFIKKDKCIVCGSCVRVCPALNIRAYSIDHQSYYAFKHSYEIRLKSSSGGFFTWLSDYILQQGGIIYGCILDQNLHVVHIGTDNINGRNRMRGSKYVQSDIGLVYRDVKAQVQSGRKVLFTGTPCQCEGLISYLENLAKSENFFTMDFICEGGSSQSVFRDFIEYYEKRKNIKIKDVIFRDKQGYPYKAQLAFCRRLIVLGTDSMENDKSKIYYSRKINNRFHDCMFIGVLQQDACMHCKFHSYEHCADVTCGDFHRYKLDTNFKDEIGLSEILVNSPKVEKLIRKIIKIPQILPCSKEDAWQPLLEGDMQEWPLKNLFWKVYEKRGFDSATKLIFVHIWRVKIKRVTWQIKQIIKVLLHYE